MQIFLTEAFTFMGSLLDAPRDARATPVRIKLQLHTIAHQHLNSMQTHLPCEVREYLLTGVQVDAEECIGECLLDDSFYNLLISHICAGKNSSKCPWSQPQMGLHRATPDIRVMRKGVMSWIWGMGYRAVSTLMVISAGSAGNVSFQNGSMRALASCTEAKVPMIDSNAD
jgi:hypothetical protein